MNTKYDMYTHVRWDDPAQEINGLKRIVHRTNPLYSLSDSIRQGDGGWVDERSQRNIYNMTDERGKTKG